MASDFEGQEVLESAVAGIPAIAEFIAAMPNRQRAIALDALERHYLQTAEDWGCSEGPTRMWVSAMMSHLRERIEQVTEPGIIDLADDLPNEDCRLAEKILTRTTGALALLVVSPLIAFVWAGLKLERPGPAISMRTTRRESVDAYQFVLGSGWVILKLGDDDLLCGPRAARLIPKSLSHFNTMAVPSSGSERGQISKGLRGLVLVGLFVVPTYTKTRRR